MLSETQPKKDQIVKKLSCDQSHWTRTLYSPLIGGAKRNSSSASTYYYDHIEGGWSNGPSLMQRRNGHAAGIVTDKVTNEQFVAVTGGLDIYNYLDSTEILQDGKWVQGKINVITLMLFYYINGQLFFQKVTVNKH